MISLETVDVLSLNHEIESVRLASSYSANEIELESIGFSFLLSQQN